MTTTQNLVDIEFALSQLGGNSDLLNRMLTRFQQEFAIVPTEVKSLLAKGDVKGAKMKVHTTKGLSGNLGLMAIFDCSKLLDQQLRDGQQDEQQIQLFETLMASTCEFIKTIDLDEKTPTNFSSKDSSNTFIDEFIQRLERHEFIDDGTLHKYVDSLRLSEDQKRNLVELVEELKYSDAIQIIQQLK